jgi:hypothetical protein
MQVGLIKRVPLLSEENAQDERLAVYIQKAGRLFAITHNSTEETSSVMKVSGE